MARRSWYRGCGDRAAGPMWAAALSLLMTFAAAGAAPVDANLTSFTLYFNNDGLNTDARDCAAVFPVTRTVPRTAAVATTALRGLFAGPTPDERQAGYYSFFSSATAGLLKRVRIASGTAYVDLNDPRDLLSGATSSCGAAQLRTQLDRTLRQFPSVERVRYAIDGDPRAFYEWLNEPCAAANDHCDPRPFHPHR
ncbi:GerMN domain-containing protein [Candidatus Thiodictyon syntrophicum]|nr:GerMN domain-containing protein [Candidatus Thiodictyon syntrophicum]